MKKVKWILIGAAVVLTAVIAAYLIGRAAPRGTVQVESEPEDRLISERVEISGETIRSGLADIGELATEEYYFTQVETYDSTKSAQLFHITFDIPLTRTKFIYSYDGIIKAGVDFTKIEVEKDELKRLITVTLPPAAITDVDIDPESFLLYSEKAGLGNPISAADFNNSLIELETTAREKALERGVLTRADENAHALARIVIGALVDLNEYTLVFARAKG